MTDAIEGEDIRSNMVQSGEAADFSRERRI